MIHYKRFSIERGHVRVTMDLSRYADRFPGAQKQLGEMVLQSCRARMPQRTGDLQQRSYVAADGNAVVFPGPSARYLYMGRVMVDAETGNGPRKIPTGPGGEYVLRFRRGDELSTAMECRCYHGGEGRTSMKVYRIAASDVV
ncbi:MAG: hypothetical protein IJT94_06695, partial [Oscillibacter sp.]|nr:hypothetical protein [Oscillibacter sp.]